MMKADIHSKPYITSRATTRGVFKANAFFFYREDNPVPGKNASMLVY